MRCTKIKLGTTTLKKTSSFFAEPLLLDLSLFVQSYVFVYLINKVESVVIKPR